LNAASPILDRSTPKAPKRAGARARLDAILDAAEALAATRGIEGLSLPLLAQAAGVPASSLYHFFPSTEAVLVALVRRYNGLMDQALEAAIEDLPTDTWQAMARRLSSRARAFHDAHPVYARLILRTAAFDALRDADDEHIRQLARRFLDLLRTHFHVPDAPDLVTPLSVAMAISDRIWALLPDDDGNISDKAFEESQIAMIAYLANYLPPRMAPRRAA
jgi:AcrR family transcriptional regulator